MCMNMWGKKSYEAFTKFNTNTHLEKNPSKIGIGVFLDVIKLISWSPISNIILNGQMWKIFALRLWNIRRYALLWLLYHIVFQNLTEIVRRTKEKRTKIEKKVAELLKFAVNMFIPSPPKKNQGKNGEIIRTLMIESYLTPAMTKLK